MSWPDVFLGHLTGSDWYQCLELDSTREYYYNITTEEITFTKPVDSTLIRFLCREKGGIKGDKIDATEELNTDFQQEKSLSGSLECPLHAASEELLLKAQFQSWKKTDQNKDWKHCFDRATNKEYVWNKRTGERKWVDQEVEEVMEVKEVVTELIVYDLIDANSEVDVLAMIDAIVVGLRLRLNILSPNIRISAAQLFYAELEIRLTDLKEKTIRPDKVLELLQRLATRLEENTHIAKNDVFITSNSVNESSGVAIELEFETSCMNDKAELSSDNLKFKVNSEKEIIVKPSKFTLDKQNLLSEVSKNGVDFCSLIVYIPNLSVEPNQYIENLISPDLFSLISSTCIPEPNYISLFFVSEVDSYKCLYGLLYGEPDCNLISNISDAKRVYSADPSIWLKGYDLFIRFVLETDPPSTHHPFRLKKSDKNSLFVTSSLQPQTHFSQNKDVSARQKERAKIRSNELAIANNEEIKVIAEIPYKKKKRESTLSHNMVSLINRWKNYD